MALARSDDQNFKIATLCLGIGGSDLLGEEPL